MYSYVLCGGMESGLGEHLVLRVSVALTYRIGAASTFLQIWYVHCSYAAVNITVFVKENKLKDRMVKCPGER